jgi:polysaccharide deacetylase family protein (PEP-CTERM system associated)
VAERHRGLVRRIAEQGHELACHGYGHQMITRLNRSEFASDVERAKGLIEQAGGVGVVGYRAPTFSVVRETLWSLDVLADQGFEYDSSIFPIVHDRYGIPDAPRFPHRRTTPSGAHLAEFPMSTVARGRWRIPVAGGGYFRLFPYALTRRALKDINAREGQPAMVYLHPWELDGDQPRLPLRPLSRFRHSVNTRRTESRLRRLLREFQFGPVRTVLGKAGLPLVGGVA